MNPFEVNPPARRNQQVVNSELYFKNPRLYSSSPNYLETIQLLNCGFGDEQDNSIQLILEKVTALWFASEGDIGNHPGETKESLDDASKEL